MPQRSGGLPSILKRMYHSRKDGIEGGLLVANHWILTGSLSFFLALICAAPAQAQLDKICGETGGPVWLASSVVFGKVSVNGLAPGAKFPKITVVLNSRGRDTANFTIDRSGNYCFRGIDGSGAILTVEVEGREVARQILPTSTYIKQFQQDFEVVAGNFGGGNKPASISVKFQHQRSEQNAKLLEQAVAAAADGKTDRALQLLQEMVASDPSDYIAWSQIGAIQFEKRSYAAAEKAYTSALAARPDLAPAMMNLGRIHLVNGKLEPAIDMLKRATTADPTMARGFQLLGEAYLLAKKGTLGVEALNEAIRLEPVAMAESHLLLATLYDRAGARFMATREYKQFLQKVPDHNDAKRFRKYIEENPDEGQ